MINQSAGSSETDGQKSLGIAKFSEIFEEKASWDNFEPTRKYQQKLVFPGREFLGEDWFEQGVKVDVLGGRTVNTMLSLGCGFGRVERRIMQNKIAHRCLGVDISGVAVDAANKTAREQGISGLTYEYADLDKKSLTADSYDLIWASGSLHHFYELRKITQQCYHALKPGGVFVAREIVGPDHQQLDCRSLEIINSAIHIIPWKYRRTFEVNHLPRWAKSVPIRRNVYALMRAVCLSPMHFREDILKGGRDRNALVKLYAQLCPSRLEYQNKSKFNFGKVFDNDPNYYRYIDPTEGVHSSEIIQTTKDVFNETEVRHYNGTVLSNVFSQLNDAFFEDYEKSEHLAKSTIDGLICLDEAAAASREVPPSYAAIFAKKSNATTV
jgi:SAM-dependent methyltransferase